MCRFALGRDNSSQQNSPRAGNSPSHAGGLRRVGAGQFGTYGSSVSAGDSEYQLTTNAPDSLLDFNFSMDICDLMEPSDFLELMQDTEFFLPSFEPARNKHCGTPESSPLKQANVQDFVQALSANVFDSHAPKITAACSNESEYDASAENASDISGVNLLPPPYVFGAPPIPTLNAVKQNVLLKQESEVQSSEVSKDILYALHLDTKRKSVETEEDLHESFERLKRKRRESSQRSRAKRTDYIKTLELENALLRDEVLKLRTYMTRGSLSLDGMNIGLPQFREQLANWNTIQNIGIL